MLLPSTSAPPPILSPSLPAVTRSVREFGTFTADLHRLADWLTACGVETVVMESTGVYLDPAL